MIMVALAVTLVQAGESRLRLNINPAWRFALGDPVGTPSAMDFNDAQWDVVSLRHTHTVLPADLSGFKESGRNVGWYRRSIDVPAAWSGKRVFVEFQGAMQTTKLWVNGAAASASQTFSQTSKPIPNPHLWSPDDPYLHQVRTIVQQDGREIDRVTTRLGIRWTAWDKEKGVFLNGKATAILNVGGTKCAFETTTSK